MTKTNLHNFLGKIPTSITGGKDDDEIRFKFSDGSSAKMHHEQDCCERVYIESITGELQDLIGYELLVAEERKEHHDTTFDSSTWTFYTFRNIKASVDIRWIGESSGYYSEAVNISYEES